ncbi:Pyruvate/2-oxoglutarate dehydrogenase complex, dihydrolipoamide dehydrogenase (E3) component [Allgaiera indica]|uniref:Pyruvate/2-oxoglutarate dehydrogenase complex, dihydrolipoamide dehydrogenase (E3) component n=1 Tax=Allgaiera indica TaxID=765699 RepID=A0A1H2U663_9RHOB|nr:Pyruvate/2-oxoglutarate dehydrogenase complex, dihydrolipoamide dehydrogenase (E3) component [Allgaiera indica]
MASGAAQMGARVVLIEADKMGGDCLNSGCVPSKALIAAAQRAHTFRHGGLGTAGSAPQVDFPAVMAHVRATIAAIAPHDSQERFEGLGVRVIRARARFASDREIEAGGQQIRARRFVIATGSRPAIPPIPGLANTPYLTNETIFGLDALPRHLIVLGGGPIGIELAQAFRRLGAEVTVIEAASALGREDPDLAQVALAGLRAEGVEIREKAPALEICGSAGAVEVKTEAGTIRGSHLLVATGRTPATEDLGLDHAGIETHDGAVKVDAHLRSSNRRVYAVGDVAGRGQFTHLAGYHAGIVLRALALGLPARLRSDHIPRVTYSDPEIAQVGLTEAEARALWPDIEVIRTPLAGNDRARAEGIDAGLLKLVIRRGRPLGAGIAAPGAGEMIAFWALALAARHKLSAIAGTVLPYPTLSEISKSAAGTYFSPKLFANPWIERMVRLVQRLP